MADTLTRRSPLQGYQSRFAELSASTTVIDEPFVAMVDLWVDPSGPGGRAVADVLAVDALPTTPSTIVSGRESAVIWLGPQEWLVTSERRDGEDIEAALREAMSEHGGAAVDVSAQRTTLRLRGEHARDVIAKGCSLDLHPAVFAPGAAAQTVLGQAGVVLIPLSDNGSDYRIIVRSSFARYLADWLIDAAEQYGVDW
ncbi:sarcosine oxidase subunit gamma [Mycobacterium sp. ITM-2016-00318]|uniref:sarcosine oxidase subunit gamma n=1 Tax=Mycobacterium sp. ITM-2016-00318 TaxID=2099693 RepID=UPI000CF9CA58|nr:sarcosine oxidase subunit gamma family protein [Mycobacterium sp. ITM-2016-00318]WNG94353.1 sarcosine oxidase subunit gamma family protein [Mycobacterium sp. ITM-2016-00318]